MGFPILQTQLTAEKMKMSWARMNPGWIRMSVNFASKYFQIERAWESIFGLILEMAFHALYVLNGTALAPTFWDTCGYILAPILHLPAISVDTPFPVTVL